MKRAQSTRNRFSKGLGLAWIACLLMQFTAQASWAKGVQHKAKAKVKAKITAVTSRSPASARPGKSSITVTESDKPLRVNGQSRNVNMMLVLKNENEQIKFVKVRKNYQDKVSSTHF